MSCYEQGISWRIYVSEQFFEVPVVYRGIQYRNNEAAFQAQKCTNDEERKKISNLSASEAKKLGRKVVLRKDWERVKIPIMKEIVKAKFEQNPILLKQLLDTKDAYLEEGNDWGDRIWGTVNGEGANHLGRILMEVRTELNPNEIVLAAIPKIR